MASLSYEANGLLTSFYLIWEQWVKYGLNCSPGTGMRALQLS
jgi:hypothetical protein